MKDFALVAVLGILACWKVNNLRGINAALEFKIHPPRNQTLNFFSNLQTTAEDRFHPPALC
jgi:hypothetical protein